MNIIVKKIIAFIKKETVLTIAWILAFVSCFFVKPDKNYISYIDFRTLGILWSLMIIMEGFKVNGVFEELGNKLLHKTKKVWQLCSVLIFLCFFTSMLITNDVALITFVPFALLMLKNCNRKDLIVSVVVLQTMAANLGSMLTPIGNPQNLYLYGISGMKVGEFLLCMLPYTVISFLLIVISILGLKGKSEPVGFDEGNDFSEKMTDEKDDVSMKRIDTEIKNEDIQQLDREQKNEAAQQIHTAGENHSLEYIKSAKANKKKNVCILAYGLLFTLALLVVLRAIPNVFDINCAFILVAVVFLVVLLLQNKILFQIDYALLFTFIGFFIFTGNLGRIPVIRTTLTNLIEGREILVAVIASQGISNVPAALLLSGFTNNYKALLLGVDLGGLGTLIASMASLISYKMVAHEYNEIKGKYFIRFTIIGLFYLAVLLIAAYFLTR